MRVLQILIAIVFVALGMVFSALNAEPVVMDLYFDQFSLPLGVLLLLAMLAGALLGGMALLAGVVWPLRRQLRRARSRTGEAAGPQSSDTALLNHPPRP